MGHIKAGLLFLLGSAVATGLSVVDLLGVRILAAVIGLAVFVFWVIDAFKLHKFVDAAGAAPAKTNE